MFAAPVAVTVNVAVWPEHAVKSDGCVVIVMFAPTTKLVLLVI